MLEESKSSDLCDLTTWWRKNAREDFGPFGQPEWFDIYREVFSDKCEFRMLGVAGNTVAEIDFASRKHWKVDARTTTALIPIEIYENGTIRFAGGTELTDYAGPVCTDDKIASVAIGFADWLFQNRDKWTTCIFEAIPEELGFGKILVEQLNSAGIEASRNLTEICAILDLPSNFEAYLSSLSKKERHELRRKWHRFVNEVGEPKLVTANSESLQDDLALFFEWHRQAQGSKGEFMDDRMQDFFTQIATSFMKLGALRLDFTEVEGVRYAASFGFVFGTRQFLYNSAYRHDARRLSPGMVLFWLMLERGLDSGIRYLDFLQGDEKYKFKLGARTRALETIEVHQRK